MYRAFHAAHPKINAQQRDDVHVPSLNAVQEALPDFVPVELRAKVAGDTVAGAEALQLTAAMRAEIKAIVKLRYEINKKEAKNGCVDKGKVEGLYKEVENRADRNALYPELNSCIRQLSADAGFQNRVKDLIYTYMLDIYDAAEEYGMHVP